MKYAELTNKELSEIYENSIYERRAHDSEELASEQQKMLAELDKRGIGPAWPEMGGWERYQW